jgi:CheY-like chemotaxis protein
VTRRTLLRIFTFTYVLRISVWRLWLFSSSAGESHPASEEGSDALSQIRKRRLRILIIDDNQVYRKSMVFKLRRTYGADAEGVASGQEGVEKVIRANSYDLIFLDIMMPEMGGVETYHRLMEVDSRSHVVFMSAFPSSDEWKKAKSLGAVLLDKPIPEDKLVRTLCDCLEKTHDDQ